jgi:acetyl esterase/lipase
MSRRLAYLGGLGVLCGLGGLLWALGSAQEVKPKALHEADVVFTEVGGEKLLLDLARPSAGEGPFPAVICLHGGGWVSGSRKQFTQTINVLAKRGYVAIAPDYRLAPKHRWPACLEDCKASVRWLRENAERYRIAPERIGVVGLSAGGHLACMMGVSDEQVHAVVSLAGPTDLTAEELWTKDVRTRNLEPLFGGPPESKRDELRLASPLHQSPRTYPLFLLMHGSADPAVPVKQAEAMAEKVRAAGGTARLVIWEGAGQTWAGDNLTRSIDQMLTFLDVSLKK